MSLVKFSDVVRRANTKEDKDNTDKEYYVGGEHIESNNVLISDRGIIKGSTIGPMFYFGFKAGQVLFVSRNPHLRKAGMVTFDGICSEKTFVLESVDESILLQNYLPFIMQSNHFWDYMEAHKSGSVNYFVNWSTLANYEFDLPDISTQREISDLLWSINDTKNAYKKVLKSIDEMVTAQFIELFGDGVNISSEAESVPLSNIFDKPQAGEWGKDDPEGSGVPVLRTTNFTDEGFVDYSDVTTRTIDHSKIEKKALQYGDILIEKSGGSVDKPVGRVVFFEGDSNKYLNNNFTARLHLNGKYEIDKVYAFYFMFVNYWAGGTKLYEGKTTGIHNLRLNDYLQNTFIPLASISSQKRIVELIEHSNSTKKELEQCIDQLIRLQKKIISDSMD